MMNPSNSITSLPRVTIALPTLNRLEYLRIALQSALNQTYASIEVIVSNNASTDETADYLASCTDSRLHVLQQAEMLSMTQNWNACLAAGTGEYFLLLSDDDLLEPDAIRQMMAAYTEAKDDSELGVVYCGGCLIDAAGVVMRSFKSSPQREDARSLIVNFFEGKRDLWFCGALLRTADLAPGFPANYQVACDAAVWMRTVIRHGYAAYIPEQLVRYRVHASLSSATRQEVWRAEYKQLQELVLAEHRRTGKPNPQFEKRLRSALKTIDRSLLLDSINASFRGKKIRLLLGYMFCLPSFLSYRGMLQMSRAIALLLLGQRFANQVRRLRNRLASGA